MFVACVHDCKFRVASYNYAMILILRSPSVGKIRFDSLESFFFNLAVCINDFFYDKGWLAGWLAGEGICTFQNQHCF